MSSETASVVRQLELIFPVTCPPGVLSRRAFRRLCAEAAKAIEGSVRLFTKLTPIF
jgi:hypothetical protein